MSYEKFNWKQTLSGRWERATDEIEHFYFSLAKLYEGSGRMFFAMTGHVILKANPIPDLPIDEAERRLDAALREGWLALRFDHPTIASQVFLNGGATSSTKVYQSPQNSDDLDAWVRGTLVSVSESTTGEEWANSDPPAPLVPKLFVLRPANSELRRDLVLRSPHEILDGIGTLQTLNNLIRHVANAYEKGPGAELTPKLGSEIKNLSPPYRVAANVPVELTPSQQQRIQEINAQKAAASKGSESVPILTIPYKVGETRPGRHQRVNLWLSEEQTSALVASCKLLGVTVTHAFHAAIAMAVRDLQKPPVTGSLVGQYVNYILRNERTSCFEPYSSAAHPVTVYHSVSGQALVIDMDLSVAEKAGTREPSTVAAEFADILRQIRDFYHNVRDDVEHYAFAPSYWAASTPSLPSDRSIPPVPPPKTTPTASISSMGKIDTVIQSTQGKIEVYDPWVTGEELGNGYGAFLGTFRGRLCLSAAYNDAWHNKEETLEFLCRCKDIVFTSLDI
ncbi:unnamed protein product [Clonostachys rosea]|uniref:Condensation domain-containing protein n=1 Tax=Bionectria ochroleuca TaxID=29856 RepID=A0ABY6UHP1_BIOOC|nr:unnamed protein product [Clonostachys rosea]